MRYRFLFISVLFFFSVATANQVPDCKNLFIKNLCQYFKISNSVVNKLHSNNISNEELTVVLKISQLSNTAPDNIASSRLRGFSWSKIINVYGINKKELYYTVEGDITSLIYTPLIDQFRKSPITEWEKIKLSDADIINLINLKFISSHHDYSIFKIMDLRDFGNEFTSINKIVFDIREKQIKQAKIKRNALARARKNAGQTVKNPHNFFD